ncbi:hypothetical protein [Corynebacterium pilosum]|uniref:hypothetical protein n=1 Tax=Corynebacterium pilosum TaxID=35756 RepID=UPI00069F58A4|nr:hypothetical protein [Corynebacterium pilosum]
MSILDLAAILGVIIVIPLTLSGIAWFMVWDATKVFPLEAPSVGLTILHPVAIHLIGLIIGMGPTLWKALARRFGIAEVLVDGATRAHQLMLRLAGAALIVYLAVLIAGHERLGELAAATRPCLVSESWDWSSCPCSIFQTRSSERLLSFSAAKCRSGRPA